MNTTAKTRLFEALAVLLLASALIWPLFQVKYLDNWRSIESTFIADARILSANLPHPGWQPLWYCGTRFDYIYPPALRYGTALISTAARVSPARAYHLYTAILYVFGIASVYWLVIAGSRSRINALMASAAVALLSPSLFLIHALRADSPWLVPQRLHVLMAYGEGPHISALSILGAAMAAVFVALQKWRPAALALAGGLCALTVANNFYGATALAMMFPLAVWSVWLGRADRAVLLRAVAIAALAYGLSAFWLTPSFLRITLSNLKWVSAPSDPRSRLILLVAIGLYGFVSYRFANRKPDRVWITFTAGCALVFSVDVLGYYYFGLRIAGEAARLAPELDLALLLLATTILTSLWNVRKFRIAAVVLTFILFLPSAKYIRHAYSPFPRAQDWQNQYERRISKWVSDNLHGERVHPSGTVRFWFDAWFDNPQMDGGSDQGMLNQVLPAARYQIAAGGRGDVAALWLQALGTSAVVVPDNTSFEPYHDYVKPEKFRGVLSPIFDDQHGTVIYRVPRIYPDLVRTVDREKEAAIGEIRGGDDIATLTRYVSIIEAPQEKSSLRWMGTDRFQIGARLGAGQIILLQETFDPAWHAYENGKELSISADRTMGFMLIEASPGLHSIDVKFETPAENRAGQLLFVVSIIAIGGLMWKARRTVND